MSEPQSTPAAFRLFSRREPFEHGLLPIPKLIFTDGTQTLSQLKSTFLSSNSTERVDSDTLSRALQLSVQHARLLIDTVSHDHSDEIGVHVCDLLVFLYIQSYKRLLPKGHRDSAAVADVWPSTSPFDGFLSALSPLQLVRSNSRMFIPSQADEQAHQLSYLLKHIGNIISLLADYTEEEGEANPVLNCHESVIYILAPLKYVTVYGCSDATIVIGAVGKSIRVEHCECVHLVTATRRICIANCRECLFFLGVNQRPLIVGDNHKLQVTPYNTFYWRLEEHMSQVGVDPSVNRWDEPLVLGLVDPHDSLSHPAGISDVQAESATCLDPDQYNDLVIPNWLEGQQDGATKHNPFSLPDSYLASQQKNVKSLVEVKKLLRETRVVNCSSCLFQRLVIRSGFMAGCQMI